MPSHTDNNHRQSTAYDRQQQKYGAAANNNGAAGSKPYARDNTPRKTPRQSEYDTSHVTCTTTASAMTANRVSMNNGNMNRHGRAGDAHEHEYRSRWDGNANPQTAGRSMYGRTSGFDGNMAEYNSMKASRHGGHRNDSEGKHDFLFLSRFSLDLPYRSVVSCARLTTRPCHLFLSSVVVFSW